MYPVSDIQNYFNHIIKKFEAVTDNPPIRIYVNQIENRITFRLKAGYYLERLIPKTIKLVKNTKNKIFQDKNGEKLPHL